LVVIIFSTLIFLVSVFKTKTLSPSLGLSSFFCGYIGIGLQILIFYRLLLFISNPSIALMISLANSFLGAFIGAKLQEKLGLKFILLVTLAPIAFFIFKIQELTTLSLLSCSFIICVLYGTIFPLLLKSTTNSSTNNSISIFAIDMWGAVCAYLFLPILLENMGLFFVQKFLIALLVILLAFSILAFGGYLPKKPNTPG
jgi:hypothetical protein